MKDNYGLIFPGISVIITQHMDRYRSGHNGPDSKSGSPAMGSWVRIPPCPPKNTGTHPGVCIFCLGGIRTGAVVNGAPGEKAPCRCRGQMKAWRFFRSRSFCKAMRTQTCKS